MLIRIVRWFLLLSIVGSNCLIAQPAFFRKDIFVGERPLAVVAGDFNGDGWPDLAVGAPEGIFTLLNTGDGNLGHPVRTEGLPGRDLVTFSFGTFVAAADFNGDGKDDLAGNGVLLLSHGDGTFLPARNDLALVVATGDFNGDGGIDLLRGDGQGVQVLLGNGDGTFQPGAMVTNLVADQVMVADFNRDGRSDVAVLPKPLTHAPLLVFLGQGDGAFGPEIRTEVDFSLMWLFLPADFNNDGLPDLATRGGIALGKGDGTFESALPYPSFWLGRPLLSPIAAADFTGDGRPDLVMSNGRANFVSIFPGKGDGGVLPSTEQSVGWHAFSEAAVDLDEDGRLDLVTVNQGSNSVSVLMARAQDGPALRRAVSAASDAAIVAPESLATLFAPTGATFSSASDPPWPTSLGGIRLEVRDSAGATLLAPLVYVSPTQINFQVPAGTALGEATLAVADDSGTTEAGSMQVDAVAPGLFMLSHPDGVPAATGVLVEASGAQISVPVFSCFPSVAGIFCEVSAIPLSDAGNRPIYLSFYGTGFRGASLDSVTCSISGVQVPVAYAGPQGTPGLDQINIRLLPELLELFEPAGNTVTIRVDGVVANSAWIALR